MSRPAVVYVVMLIVLIGGLWTVLAIGRHLNAPSDLAGKWQLTPLTADSTAQALTVEQSGKFFEVSFEHGPQLNLKLKSRSPMLLVNKTWQLTFDSPGDDDDSTVRLDGPKPAQWSAHRTVRTFPADVESKGAK